jgi:hypothetical protein
MEEAQPKQYLFVLVSFFAVIECLIIKLVVSELKVRLESRGWLHCHLDTILKDTNWELRSGH